MATPPPYATRQPTVTQVDQVVHGEESAPTNQRSFATPAHIAYDGPRTLRHITWLEAQRLRMTSARVTEQKEAEQSTIKRAQRHQRKRPVR